MVRLLSFSVEVFTLFHHSLRGETFRKEFLSIGEVRSLVRYSTDDGSHSNCDPKYSATDL